MKKLYTSPDLLFIQHLKLLLESHGIQIVIKNQEISSLQGGIPAQDTWPELWLIDEDVLPKAENTLKKLLSSDKNEGSPWKCTNCNEQIEPQFTHCWNCNTQR